MKRFLSLLCAAVLIIGQSITVLAAVDIPDAFGNEFIELDVNMDGDFNICDLVRIKKYTVGDSTFINLNFLNDADGDAELLVLIRQELLKGGN